MTEEWRAVPGYQGLYEASSLGRVRSFARYPQGHVLSPGVAKCGYRTVHLKVGGPRMRRPIHVVVALTFLGPRPDGMETRHLDGDRMNNRLDNLAYGTPHENAMDKVRHGGHHLARRDACAQGHRFSPDNTWVMKGVRMCKTCRRNRLRAWRARNPEKWKLQQERRKLALKRARAA